MLPLNTSQSGSRFEVRFKVAGIPVAIDPSFFILTLFIAFRRSSEPVFMVEWIAVVLVSILIHELGHAFAARAFGLVPTVRLYSMGGLTSFGTDPRFTPARSIAVSIAGPGAGFIIGSIVLLARLLYGPGMSFLASVIVEDLLWVNFGWGLVNLLPIRPLDGGSVARSVEEWVTGKKTGIASIILSVGVAAAVAIWAFQSGQMWILLIMGYLVFLNAGQLYARFGKHSDEQLRDPLARAWKSVEDGDGDSAVNVAVQVLKSAKSNEIRGEASALMALGYYRSDRSTQARTELERMHTNYGAAPYDLLLSRGQSDRAILLLGAAFRLTQLPWTGRMLSHSLIEAKRYDEAMELCFLPELEDSAAALLSMIESGAFTARDYELSARAGKASFERLPNPVTAYNVACALAHAAKSEEAVQWLGRALEAGFAETELLRTDPDLDALRGRPDFERLIASQSQPQSS